MVAMLANCRITANKNLPSHSKKEDTLLQFYFFRTIISSMSFTSCLQKQETLKKTFSSCISAEERYKKIIELGSTLPAFDLSLKTSNNRVFGCQSEMFLHTLYKDGLLIFYADSDALISKGLAALLISVYSHESPEAVLKCPPSYLSHLQIPQSLSPSRSNGLSSLFLRMQQEAIKYFSRSI